MHKQIVAFAAVALLVGFAVLSMAPAAADTKKEDRELTYVGTTRVDHGLNQVCEEELDECPIIIPSGIIFIVCDNTDGIEGSGIHGIGGGVFCTVATDKWYIVTQTDLAGLTGAAITCPSHTESFVILTVTWHQVLTEATAGGAKFFLPPDCMEEGKPDHTNVGVFVNVGSGSGGTVALVQQ